jgi:hypothetical protein
MQNFTKNTLILCLNLVPYTPSIEPFVFLSLGNIKLGTITLHLVCKTTSCFLYFTGQYNQPSTAAKVHDHLVEDSMTAHTDPQHHAVTRRNFYSYPLSARGVSG